MKEVLQLLVEAEEFIHQNPAKALDLYKKAEELTRTMGAKIVATEIGPFFARAGKEFEDRSDYERAREFYATASRLWSRGYLEGSDLDPSEEEEFSRQVVMLSRIANTVSRGPPSAGKRQYVLYEPKGFGRHPHDMHGYLPLSVIKTTLVDDE